MIKDDAVGIGITKDAKIATPKRLHLIRRGFRDVACRDDLAVRDGQNAHTSRILASRDSDRDHQIELGVGTHCGKWALRANDHQRLSRPYGQIEEEGRLFKRVGALDPDDPIDIVPAGDVIQ
jgi:hypothetical protein